MAKWTAVGDLFAWPPYLALTNDARVLWLALYVSGEAKRYPAGLFRGGVAVLAEAAHMPAPEVIAALGELRDHRLIERDEQRKIIRMTHLPDKAERPPNGNCLRMWWNAFRSMPECPVRDRYVDLLEWLTHPMTADHERVWSTTWGTVTRTVSDTVSQLADPISVFQGALVFSTTPETVPDTVSDTVGVEGRGIRDQGSETLIPRPTYPQKPVDNNAPLSEAEIEAGFEIRQAPAMHGMPAVTFKAKRSRPPW